jgi:hypothetical protein
MLVKKHSSSLQNACYLKEASNVVKHRFSTIAASISFWRPVHEEETNFITFSLKLKQIVEPCEDARGMRDLRMRCQCAD